uniref:Periplasmic nitrate reductase chaperone NapD n=1 Tax=Candidatus Kentrum sp. LPFa TaxID=2126335 RepID=A0A450WQN7_9GAMM|nr:MAG: periplasmic nitrate reductase chaperone NapD [Candidatus Kentron sp. LPFa]
MPAIQDALGQWQGVEVHATVPDERIVVTVEDDDPERFGRTIFALGEMNGVLDASPVFYLFPARLCEWIEF